MKLAVVLISVFTVVILAVVLARTPSRPASQAVAPPTRTPLPTLQPTATTEPTPLPRAILPDRPAIGAEGHLWARGLKQWHLTIDKQALADEGKAAAANDTAGLEQLIISGRAFPVSDGTRVLVLEQDLSSTKVRVLEGPQQGRIGWADAEQIRR